MNELFDYGRPAKIHLVVARRPRRARSCRSARSTSAPTLAVPHGHMLRLVRDDGGRLGFRLSPTSS